MRNLLKSVVAIVVGLSCASWASAATVTFFNISNDSGVAASVGSQLTADVTDPGSSQVDFKFLNTGSIASSITDIYFDDGSLLGIASVINGPGTVSFSAGANPAELPGANNVVPPFVTTTGFSADSNPPVSTNGVANFVSGTQEFVTIRFNLQGGKVFNDVLSDLNSGALRIGLHVQSIGPSSASDSFVSKPPFDPGPTPIPLPATVWMGALGLIGVGLMKYRRLARA